MSALISIATNSNLTRATLDRSYSPLLDYYGPHFYPLLLLFLAFVMPHVRYFNLLTTTLARSPSEEASSFSPDWDHVIHTSPLDYLLIVTTLVPYRLTFSMFPPLLFRVSCPLGALSRLPRHLTIFSNILNHNIKLRSRVVSFTSSIYFI